ncbi:MAG: putative xanthine dehydrogenase subunit [Pedosphaera sp.]|nr:putative xanthine dehydrogenase subunit [Pedosphaera sp.]
MKELTAIIQACARQGDKMKSLATVVQTTGSSYRRPGARMLVFPEGETVGSISGGCLEQDVILQAQKAMESGKNAVLSYDTTPEEDVVFGVGMGCKGVVQILVECLPPRAGGPNDAVSFPGFVEDLFKHRQTGAVATVVSVEGRTDVQVGNRLMLHQDGRILSDVPDDILKSKMLSEAREALGTGGQAMKRHEFAAGSAEVFAEVIHSPMPLVICGAGYDAQPMVRLARELGFHVTVVDGRPAYASAARFPEADAVALAPVEGMPGELDLGERTAAVIMSHNYLRDRNFLKALLPKPLGYLGLMGPRKRAEQMLAELRTEGVAANESQLRALHNPVGLDIGADTPEQIALAILAEIQAVMAGHAGGLLREKKGPIHAQSGTGLTGTAAGEPVSNRKGIACAASVS